VAASIKKTVGIEPALVVGGRGEFTVWVEEKIVAQKGPLGFPTEDEVLAAVQKALTNR
jgi:hypothetical protein